MFDLFMAGGWVMWPIYLCSIAALAIIGFRFWVFRRSKVLPPDLGEEVRRWASSKQLDPAHIDQLRTDSPLGELLAAALDVRHRPRELIKERVEDVGRHVAHRLERFLNVLGTIASIAPLLGLLGTVVGMIKLFLDILGNDAMGDASMLAGGIGQALVSTAVGLIVAIPALMFYRYFRGQVTGYVIDMEQQAMALLDTLEDAQRAPAPARRKAPVKKPAPRK